MLELAVYHRSDHSERANRIVVERDGLRGSLRGGHGLRRSLHRLGGCALVAPGDEEQDDRRDDREHSDPEVEQEGDEQEQGEPGHVEQSARDRASDRLPDRLEIAHGLDGGIRVARHHPLEDLRSEKRVKPHAGANEEPVADRIQGGKRE